MFPPVILIVYLGGLPFAALLLVTFCISMYEWSRLSFKTSLAALLLPLGFVYLGGAYYLFYLLRELPEIGLILTVLTYVSVWSSDTFAYIFGKKIGGPKLLPSISPNKTRAGLVGAMFGAMIVLVIGKVLLGTFDIDKPYMTFVFIITFGAILGVIAQAGDLMISALKRAAKQKDSGNIIPGHGGLLDRIDALILVAPVFYFMSVNFLTGS